MPEKKSYAGIWSIVLALAPLGVILLFLLPILLGDYTGEAGLAALCGIAMILYFGMHAIVVTSVIGSAAGIVGIRRGRRKQGTVGLALNVVLLGTSVALLASHYHKVYSDPERLNMAVSKGDMAMVKKLLGKGFHVNQRDHKGWTPLHEAVANGYMEIAACLLENGADARSRSYRGESPLHLVSAWGRRRYWSLGEWDGSDVVDLLIKHGADVDARCEKYGGTTKRNWTALQIASDTNNTNIMRRLIEYGADVTAEAFNGETALYLAGGRGYIEAVEILMENGAGVNNGGSKRRYALLGAVKGRKKRMVEYLLSAGADANVADGYEQNGLHHAIRARGNDEIGGEIMRLLVDAGADVNKANKGGETPLHRAATYHRLEAVQFLLEHGADVNAGRKQGQTPLYVAVYECHPERPQRRVVEILLESGAEVDFKDERFRHGTALQRVGRWKVKSAEEEEYRRGMIELMEGYQ